jgi:hypothetical protein
MKQIINKLLLLLTIALCAACSNDDDAPQIDSVWKNMISEPLEKTDYAYPGQTICLHGSAFYDLRKVFVNGTDIDLTTSFIYDTENYITIQLPADVNVSISDQQEYIRVITAHGESVYRPFLVKPLSEQPVITKFSSTQLTAGDILTITGQNLEGTTEVWLPLTYNGYVSCELDPATVPTATSISVIIPADVNFAKGKCYIVMQKTDALSARTYTEKVYSSETNFRN